MSIMVDIGAVIEAARREEHVSVDRRFDALLAQLIPASAKPAGTTLYRDPTDEDCRDPRNKNGPNLTPWGVEILFRLLDAGAGYNSAGRKLGIAPSAVKNRKKEWEAKGGPQREKLFIPHLDTIA